MSLGDRRALLPPDWLQPPAGSYWEACAADGQPDGGQLDGGRRSGWRQLVRLPAAWREAVRSSTALRSLEAGSSTWACTLQSSYLAWRGAWASRRDDMRSLQVLVDGVLAAEQHLPDSAGVQDLVLYEGAGPGQHEVQIYFPATTTLRLEGIWAEPGSRSERLPALKRWCAWGDSITQGSICPSAGDTYVQTVARATGWTAINRGFGGAGFPDPSTALAVAALEPWDVLSVALGTNSVLNGLETPEEFAAMYRLCLELLAQRVAGRPIVCISPFVCAPTDPAVRPDWRERWGGIRAGIAQAVEALGLPGVQYVDGLALLGEPELLAPDGTHPMPAGHARLGERLAPRLASALASTTAAPATDASVAGSYER